MNYILHRNIHFTGIYENIKQNVLVQKLMGIIKDVMCSIEAQPSFYKISSNPF